MTMHKWPSQEKLISQLECQEAPANSLDSLTFRDFKYEKFEFENMPAVLPRFLFFLQMNLRTVYTKLRLDSEKQTTAELRQETQQWFSQVEL